jgi:hypothetical protein
LAAAACASFQIATSNCKFAKRDQSIAMGSPTSDFTSFNTMLERTSGTSGLLNEQSGA